MTHEFSKRLLDRADTFELRQKAVRAAIGLGMPLDEIEAYLDWIDQQQKPIPPAHLNSMTNGRKMTNGQGMTKHEIPNDRRNDEARNTQ